MYVTDGHYKGYILPLEDYETFMEKYPIEYRLARCHWSVAMMSIRRELRTHNDEREFSLRALVPPWLAVLIGLTGSALGLATNLYSDQFEGSDNGIGEAYWSTPVSVARLGGRSGSALLIYRWLQDRRREQSEISQGELPIGSDALKVVINDQDVIVGRTLSYLETRRDSEDLLVFLHGLGLDASDFRPYMTEEPNGHCLALTLYGFNAEEKDDQHYKPISLESHVQLLGYALGKIAAQYPNKRITLVGFSFGADLVSS